TFLLLTFLFPYISCFQILDLTLLLLILKEVYCNMARYHIVNDVILVPRLLGSRKKNDVMKVANTGFHPRQQ
ncbi:MAG: hypothetical protein ACEY3B_02565, partial [Wolbachia sp.]